MGADCADVQAHQFVLGDAAVATHLREPLADQEDRVAHDRAGERDLDHEQRGRGAVTAQRRQDGKEVHGGAPQCDLSWMAGDTWQPRHAGRVPASRLLTTASAKVVTSIGVSMRASSEYS